LLAGSCGEAASIAAAVRAVLAAAIIGADVMAAMTRGGNRYYAEEQLTLRLPRRVSKLLIEAAQRRHIEADELAQ
jgi:hypothetical protein